MFICPFNPYHRLMSYTKWQFHITRCGDRRGKVVYRCQYASSHFFCDKEKLIHHEENECQYRHTQKRVYDNSDEAVREARQPSAVYCKYDVGHVFDNIKECQQHMEICPRREEFNRKAEQCHQKFTANKSWIRAAQQEKRRRE